MSSKGVEQISVGGRLLAWAFLLGLLSLVAVQLVRSQRGILTRGEPAPSFTLTTFDGATLGPEDMAGKVVLVNFWASWCKPCEQEAEELQTAWELYADRGDVLFLGVDYVDTEREALAYLERWKITYPNGPDLGTQIYTAFRARGVPETVIINKLGEVAIVKIGPFQDLDEITAAVDRLLDP
jgi:cytochrome c biogenesis protein CcmG/thiol:disulfide interchange protein DsbE